MYRILIIAYRKPSLTPDEFKTHYEQKHVPLVKSIAGSHFPLSHTRQYIRRVRSEFTSIESKEHNADYPAVVLSGPQTDMGYDAIAELKFKDHTAFVAFTALLVQPDNAAMLAADCEDFMDQAKTTVVELGDYVQTTADL